MRLFYTTDVPINGTLDARIRRTAFIVLYKNYNQIDKKKSPRITAYERIKIVYKYISAHDFSSPILTDGENTFASVISAPSLR